MQKKGNIVSYTAEEIDAMLARGESRTDWAKLDATTQADIERAIATDPDLAIPPDWEKTVTTKLPFPFPERNKQQVTIRLDPQVVEHFKRAGRGWQSRINAVLRSYVESSSRG
jgi:uncharacterized protein (DUF4415 family)